MTISRRGFMAGLGGLAAALSLGTKPSHAVFDASSSLEPFPFIDIPELSPEDYALVDAPPITDSTINIQYAATQTVWIDGKRFECRSIDVHPPRYDDIDCAPYGTVRGLRRPGHITFCVDGCVPESFLRKLQSGDVVRWCVATGAETFGGKARITHVTWRAGGTDESALTLREVVDP